MYCKVDTVVVDSTREIFPSQHRSRDPKFLQQEIDREVRRAMHIFLKIQTFLSLNIWGLTTRCRLDCASSDIKQYIMRTIEFGETHGGVPSHSPRLATHIRRNESLLNISFLNLIERYLTDVMLPAFELHKGNMKHFEQNIYTNTRYSAPTVTQVHFMTFKPVIAYMRKIRETMDYYMKMAEDERDRIIVDRRPWSKEDEAAFQDRMNLIVQLWKLHDLRQKEVDATLDIWFKSHRLAAGITASDPWDTAFDFFTRVFNEITSKLDMTFEAGNKPCPKPAEDWNPCRDMMAILMDLKAQKFKQTL